MDSTTQTVRFVTDPMCSWCWGMAPCIETTIERLSDRVTFDLAVGGINVDSTKPVGRYGRERLDKLWTEVTTVTGQVFSHDLAKGTVYNSMLPCLAVEAMRDVQDRPPFGFTHRLQQRFFVEAINVNNLEVLLATSEEFGVDRLVVRARMDTPGVRERTRWGFENARRYGTNALPSVLVSDDGIEFRLFAGGFVSADQLTDDLEAWLGRAP